MILSAPSGKETQSPAQSSRAIWLKRARQWHLFLGTFFAPSILFFALTGALQLFGLHEGHPGEAYQPPAWVAGLGSLHKKQTIAERRGPPSGFGSGQVRPPQDRAEIGARPQGEERRGNQGRRESKSTLALKWFFLATSVGLTLSTLLGIYMAFKFNRSRTRDLDGRSVAFGSFLGTRRSQTNETFVTFDGRICIVDNIDLMEEAITTSGYIQWQFLRACGSLRLEHL